MKEYKDMLQTENRTNSIQLKLWSAEQDILDVIHNVCMTHGLRYSLAYGTLIGAIRHKGFIPWDDDIDILMPRKDYEKLLMVWGDAVSSDYILQEPYNSPDLVVNFAKVRKNHTAFIQYEFEKEKNYHGGIFVDIFPVDKVAPNKYMYCIQKIYCFMVMLFNRGYTSGNKGIVGLCEKMLLSIVPKHKYRSVQKWAEKRATKWNNNERLEWFGFQTVADMNHHYAADVFDNLIDVEFEKKMYKAFFSYDQVLRDEFGDYMQLPPEEERVWGHHPLVIDFEHNYEELMSK